MNLVESWKVISQAIALTHPSATSTKWLVLSSQRPLLLPADCSCAQDAALKFFIAKRLGLVRARLMLLGHRLLPGLKILPNCCMAATGLTERPRDAALVAILIGTPGPYQKAAMLSLTERGETITLTKIALSPAAKPMLEAEARWLRELACYQDLSAHVPRVLAQAAAPNATLTISIGSARAATPHFTAAHEDFLSALGRTRAVFARFPVAAALAYLENLLAALPVQSGDFTVFSRAISECKHRFENWFGPATLSHGDFAPWNIRLGDDGLWVFDWEYARERANPLSDLLHFGLAPRAVTGHGVNPRRLRRTMQQAARFARQVYPDCDWSRGVIGGLTLEYLLHTVLTYSASRNFLMKEHPVIDAYYKLIEGRQQWMN